MTAPAPLVLAAPEDLDALRGWHARFAVATGQGFEPAVARAALEALLAQPELGRVYHLVEAGRRVGYAALCFGFSLEWGGRDAFIDELFVDEAVRGRGLGRAALRALVAEACAHGVRALHLEVGADNPRAEALYRAEGFAGNERRLLSRRLP